MSIYTDPPEWEAKGKKPPSSKRTEGWKPGDRVPASWLNWFWFSTVNSLQQIAQALVGHEESTSGTHGVEGPYKIAKTTREDQLVGWDDIPDKPDIYHKGELDDRLKEKMAFPLTGVAHDGEYVPLPFSKEPLILLSPRDVLVYDPSNAGVPHRLEVKPVDVSPRGFRVHAKSMIDLAETAHSAGDTIRDIGAKAVYVTDGHAVGKISLHIRERMYVHAYAGNYRATNSLTYRVRVRRHGEEGWLRTYGPVTRSISVTSSLFTTRSNSSNNVNTVTFDDLPRGKYEVEVGVTNKTWDSRNGNNTNSSCYLVVESWSEYGPRVIPADPPNSVVWVAWEGPPQD